MDGAAGNLKGLKPFCHYCYGHIFPRADETFTFCPDLIPISLPVLAYLDELLGDHLKEP